MSLSMFLPCGYAICGLVMVCNIDSRPGYSSGLQIMLVACLIWTRQLQRQEPDS